MSNALAVYSVVHPGVERFVAEWYNSVLSQTDLNFDLWISLDSASPAEVTDWIGKELRAEWLTARPLSTPAEIRSEAIQFLVKHYSGIIFVDSDDRLHPSRVSAARSGLESNELTACGLRLIDAQGQSMGSRFVLSSECSPDDVFPCNNVFGLSNSAYSSALLERCLPISSNVVLVDWFLSTHAWLMGVKLGFDSTIRMDYRQYTANTARVTYPTHSEWVKKDTKLVRNHFEFMLASQRKSFLPERLMQLKKAAKDTERFNERIVEDPRRLELYVESLNRINPCPLWWSAVAHPALAVMWEN